MLEARKSSRLTKGTMNESMLPLTATPAAGAALALALALPLAVCSMSAPLSTRSRLEAQMVRHLGSPPSAGPAGGSTLQAPRKKDEGSGPRPALVSTPHRAQAPLPSTSFHGSCGRAGCTMATAGSLATTGARSGRSRS